MRGSRRRAVERHAHCERCACSPRVPGAANSHQRSPRRRPFPPPDGGGGDPRAAAILRSAPPSVVLSLRRFAPGASCGAPTHWPASEQIGPQCGRSLANLPDFREVPRAAATAGRKVCAAHITGSSFRLDPSRVNDWGLPNWQSMSRRRFDPPMPRYANLAGNRGLQSTALFGRPYIRHVPVAVALLCDFLFVKSPALESYISTFGRSPRLPPFNFG